MYLILPKLARLHRWQVTCPAIHVRHKVFWGHDTIEDQAERARKESGVDKRVIAWSDPKQNVAEKAEMQWAPARIHEEANLSLAAKERAFIGSGAELLSHVHNKWMKPYWLSWVIDPIYFREETIDRIQRALVQSQVFVPSRLTSLGPDLAAAHFLCFRGCRVRFKGHTHWTEMQKDGTLDIPAVYVPGWHVEAIDACSSMLVYEGFQNLKNLHHLKELDLSYSEHIDEWCMDRITGEFHASLEVLNISGCRGVDWNGLELVWRLANLKTLIIKDMEHIRDLSLICLLILDVLPKLKIEGADYLELELLEGTEHEHLLLDDDSPLKLEPGEIQQIKDEELKTAKESVVEDDHIVMVNLGKENNAKESEHKFIKELMI